MSKYIRSIAARLHTKVIELFTIHPYCVDCGNKMIYQGRVVIVESANNIFPNTSQLRFRCEEDQYETWISKDGTQRSFYGEEE